LIAYLELCFTGHANDDISHDWDQIPQETGPLTKAEDNVNGTDNHKEDGTWTEDCTDHQHTLFKID